ncbi:putative hydrolase of the alpha/beta superfamily [Cupriavidus taiwanensis]|uniref:alpha/beta hydrolase n=1 Tax=Cupriavidus taiwanensis TaxID=164546 RepID=UPI000E164857|nr:alpha/beta fold hydrolase [Cupriavidus taiwanensis]SOY93326.1 putative hydrolase of the alpha/beta superfamily [Cupriavidus taiwanensis]SOY96430.1 putative hydrolase of the alpha/beta superfamily [Cupriavidus taiwanensis]
MASHSGTESVLVQGDVGNIELLVDTPRAPICGVAVITHPHPLQGGSAGHKVPHVLAKTLASRGYLAVRPNFRGVGATEGEHDAGTGESLDTIAVVEHLRQAYSGLPLVLAGFSFGAYVIARAAEMLSHRGIHCPHLILAGTPWGTVDGQRSYETPPVPSTTLVIHGERDERVALSAVFDWARPQSLPIVVVPGANHFFTGKLSTLERLVGGYLDHLPGTEAVQL